MKDVLDTPVKSGNSARDANPRAVSVRIEARSMAKAYGTRRHDFRIGPLPKYVDADRVADNRVLREMRPLPQIRAENAALRTKAGRLRAMKSNAAVITAGIITVGREAADMIESLSPDVQDRAFREVSEAIAAKLGTRLESLVVHCDETTIHAHFTLRGYTDDGQAVSAATKAGTTAELQDVAAEVMKQHHPGIERGHRKRDRLAAGADYADTLHRSVKELHRDLPVELDALKAEKATRAAELEALRASAEKTRKHLAKLAAKAELSAKEEKRRRTYAARLAKKEAEIAKAETALRDGIATLTEKVQAQEAVEAKLVARARALAAKEEKAKSEASRLNALTGEYSQKMKTLEATARKVQAKAKEVEAREDTANKSLAAIDSLVSELDAGTISVKDDGKITLKNPSPIAAAPKSLRERLLSPIFRLVRKIDATEKKATWLESMMDRVTALLARVELEPEVREEAEGLAMEWG